MQDEQTFCLTGDCTLPHVDAHRAWMSRILETQSGLMVDLSQSDGIDLSFVQLVVSAAKTAASNNKTFAVQGMTEAARAAFSLAGVDVSALGRRPH